MKLVNLKKKPNLFEGNNSRVGFNAQTGQAMVTLLFIMVISISVITAVIVVTANNLASGGSLERGTIAYYAAESGVENALLRMLRDPGYTGESLTINDSMVTIQVSGSTITSIAEYGNTIRKIEAETAYNNNILTVISWREIN